ncbi:hypothetical protein PCE1_005003 [Barthelona sp. PCE]
MFLEQKGFRTIKQLGRGSFGTVMKIQRISDGKFFACKVVNYCEMSEKEKRYLVAEVNLLRTCKHQNIVTYEERFVSKEDHKIYLLMELCERGDLGDLIKKCLERRRSIRESIVWDYFAQITAALNYCHTHEGGQILHRDVKPQNVFVGGGDMCIKLGDFGLARYLNENSVARTNVGTPLYMSPEQLDGGGYGTKTDIWALGCTIYELCTLRPPFPARNQGALTRMILRGKFEPIGSQYSNNLSSLIYSMLSTRPRDRPNCEDILANPFIQNSLKKFDLVSDTSAKSENQRRNEKVMPRNIENELRERERLLNRREKELLQKEKELLQKERELNQREESINLKEARMRSVSREAPPRMSFGRKKASYGLNRMGFKQ